MSLPKISIGFLVPAGNRVILPEMYRMAGDRYGFFETRLMVSGDRISRESNFAMVENINRGMQEMQAAGVDACLFACTVSSFLKGKAWDEDFCRVWEDRVGFRVGTTAVSLVKSLRSLNVSKIAVATPWHEMANEAAKQYMESYGFEIVNLSGHPLNRFEVNDMAPEKTHQLAKAADAKDAECLCIFATDLPSAGIIRNLEIELGKPVISSNTAILWNAMQMVKAKAGVNGFGRLLNF